MKAKLLWLSAVGISAALVGACHDHHGGSTPPPTSPPPATSQSLDTAQVLALAQQTSETSTPIDVNGGAVTLNDTSETTSPIAVTAM